MHALLKIPFFKKKKTPLFYFLYVKVRLPICPYATCVFGVPEGQKKALNPHELVDLQEQVLFTTETSL